MLILSIRTDKPEAEIALFGNDSELVGETWIAHRQLSESIHVKIMKILRSQNKTWQDLGAIVCYKGPGSFTGLRIGLSVGNALASSLGLPVVSESGKKWINNGRERLLRGQNDKVVLPEYGAAVHTTTSRK